MPARRPTSALVDLDEASEILARPPRSGLRRTVAGARFRARRMLAGVVAAVLRGGELVVPARRAECPACTWAGLAFRPTPARGGIRWRSACPRCGARRRQRLLAVTADRLVEQRSGTCLHVAPEPALRSLWRAGPTFGIDLDRHGIALQGDVEQLPLRDESLRLVVCSDVLEHVVDDRRALTEIRRVLAPGGAALLHVPVMVTETLEWGEPRPEYHGHRRAYGPEVAQRIVDAGFELHELTGRSLSSSERRRWGVDDHDVAFVATRRAAPGQTGGGSPSARSAARAT